jgi:hypothetical protein
MKFKVTFDRFRKFKVCFELNISFRTKSELEAKLKDEKFHFSYIDLVFASPATQIFCIVFRFKVHNSWSLKVEPI